jgi:pheromone shutdown protein TraB
MDGLGGEPECPRIVNVDVTELDIARASSVYGLAQRIRSSRALFRKLETARKGGSLAYDEAIYREIADQFRESEAKQKTKPKAADRAVVDERNEIVLGHIDRMREQDEAAKAAVVWGYGHRRGLADGLEARGFRCTRMTSLTVAFNPSPFL